MRTLGSEAGRSEERATRRPTCLRKSLYVRTACMFYLASAKKGFNSNVYLWRGPMRIGYRGRIVSELCYCSVLASRAHTE